MLAWAGAHSSARSLARRACVALALCATACAVPPGDDGPADEELDTDTETDELDPDAELESRPAGPEAEAEVSGACPAYCAAFLSRCDGSLADRDAEACVTTCTQWSAEAVACRGEWLAAGSCIAAGPESPTCGL